MNVDGIPYEAYLPGMKRLEEIPPGVPVHIRFDNDEPGRSVGMTRMSDVLFEHVEEILSVGARCHAPCESADVIRRYVAHPVRNLLEACNHQSLSLFDRLHIVGGLDQRIVGSGVEPSDATPKPFDVQLPALEIRSIDIRDFKLAAGRGLQPSRDIDHLIVIEIQPGNRV